MGRIIQRRQFLCAPEPGIIKEEFFRASTSLDIMVQERVTLLCDLRTMPLSIGRGFLLTWLPMSVMEVTKQL